MSRLVPSSSTSNRSSDLGNSTPAAPPPAQVVVDLISSATSSNRRDGRPHRPPHWLARRWDSRPRLSLLGRSILLLLGEVLANALLWGVALGLFAPDPRKRSVLSLCLIAWTLGLRHGLDMDHIVAIDNVTRNLVALGRLPVTVGLFFSLGHSTIVVAATIAIVIATSAIDKMDKVSAIGGVIGVSISASFLLLLAIINSAVLWSTLRDARKRRLTPALQITLSKDEESIVNPTESNPQRLPSTTCLTRLGRPLFALINRPYKMYPIGLLFGLGFDTASEITLLGISALARRSTEGEGDRIATSEILVLPLLFTAGMTFVDSMDNIGMVWGYSWDVLKQDRKSWKLFLQKGEDLKSDETRLGRVDEIKLLRISTVLTVISILIALLISITEFMGLALEKCDSCSIAAESSSGLDGRWWRFWQSLDDNSGYLGAGVVTLFLVVFVGWKSVEWYLERRTKARMARDKFAIVVAVDEEKVEEK